MTLSELKQQIYVSLEPRRSEGGGGGRGMEVVEARLNVMQAVFLAIQTSLSLGADILLKGQQVFQTLFNRYFTEALEVPMWGGEGGRGGLFLTQLKMHCPRLIEVVDIISETSFSPSLHHDSRSVQLLMEGLFAHFFSPYRRGYHTEDIQWFLELANKQEHWGVKRLEHAQHHQPVTRTEV